MDYVRQKMTEFVQMTTPPDFNQAVFKKQRPTVRRMTSRQPTEENLAFHPQQPADKLLVTAESAQA